MHRSCTYIHTERHLLDMSIRTLRVICDTYVYFKNHWNKDSNFLKPPTLASLHHLHRKTRNQHTVHTNDVIMATVCMKTKTSVFIACASSATQAIQKRQTHQVVAHNPGQQTNRVQLVRCCKLVSLRTLLKSYSVRDRKRD